MKSFSCVLKITKLCCSETRHRRLSRNMGKSGLYEDKETESCGGFEEIFGMFLLVVLGQSGVCFCDARNDS